jgi:hypothetical protein
MKRFVSRCMFAVATIIVCSLSSLAQADAAHPVVALLPGVVDPFYFTMHRGAERAAKEENVELLFQVPKEWNTSEQVPILKAFIAKHPDVLLISPVDKQQLIPISATATTRPARAMRTSPFPILLRTTWKAAASQRARWPRPSAIRARSIARTTSRVSRARMHVPRASRTR